MYTEALIIIEEFCILISDECAASFWRARTLSPSSDAQREQQFNRNFLAAFVANNEQLLITEQRK
ncbi:unnamed protein product, partial [Ceratitis capitata]